MNNILRETKNDKIFNQKKDNQTLKNAAVKSGGFYVGSRLLDYVIQLLSTIVLARLLAPEDFGLVAMVTSITGFFIIFKDFGLSDATVQSETLSHEQTTRLFWINLLVGFILFLIVSLIAPILSWFYHDTRLIMVTVVSALGFIFAGLYTQHTALLKRNMQFKEISLIEIMGVLISTIITIIIAFKEFSYWALVLRPLIGNLCVTIGIWYICKWIPGKPTISANVKSFLSFGFNTLGFYFVNYFARTMDKILIGWKEGPASLGFYHKAYHLFVAPINQFSIPLHSVAVSSLTKLKNQPELYRKYYLRAISILCFIGMPMSIFTTASAKDLILLLLGPKWDKTAELFMVLGFGAGIQILYSTQGWLFASLGKADKWFKWGCISTLVMVGGFFIGLPFGAMGVAIAYTISLYILVGPGLNFAGKFVGLSFFDILKSIWKYYVASIIAGIITYFYSLHGYLHNTLLMFSTETVIYTLAYILLILILFKNFKPFIEFTRIIRKVL